MTYCYRIVKQYKILESKETWKILKPILHLNVTVTLHKSMANSMAIVQGGGIN